MAVNKLDLLKDILELARNYFFAGGMLVVGGAIFHSPESLGDAERGKYVAYCLMVGAFAYMLVAVMYFEFKHWPGQPKNWVGLVTFIVRFLLLIVAVEGSLLLAAKHTDWEHYREVAAARVAKSIPTVAIPSPISRCVAGH